METPDLLFIIINYFNEDEVIDFINHLALQNFRNYKVIVVNNGSNNSDKLNESLLSFTEVNIYHSGRNPGYYPAAHNGLKSYLEEYKTYPGHIIVCNTDITIPNVNFLNELIKSSGDVKGPSIISSKTQLDQNPFLKERISKFRLRFLHIVFSFYPFYFFYQLLAIVKGKLNISSSIKSKKDQQVYALHGSFIAFNKSYFEKGGNLDYPSFLFGEELFIAETARNLKLEMNYLPSINIMHNEHTVTGLFKKPKLVKYMAQSIKYLLNSFFK